MGEWKSMWVRLLDKYRNELDMSSVDLDGSHTTALRGGEEVGYQGRKKRKTTNALYLTDRQGLPIAMSSPKSGEHHDVHNIEEVIGDMFNDLEKSHIRVDGLFLNADAGFDCDVCVVSCVKRRLLQTSASINGEKMSMTSLSMMNCMPKGIEFPVSGNHRLYLACHRCSTFVCSFHCQGASSVLLPPVLCSAMPISGSPAQPY